MTTNSLTFVRNHAKVMVACDFFVVITAAFQTLYVVPHCNRLAPLFEDPWTPSKGKLTPFNRPICPYFGGGLRGRS